MDPLSIAASIGSLSGVCLLTVKKLIEVSDKFQDAPKILQRISSEAKVVAISLSQLHNTLISDERTTLAKTLLTPEVRDALDIALTGCSLTVSSIHKETRSLIDKIDPNLKMNLADRVKVVWKDDKFKELLNQLHRQHNVIAILQQGLQMKALADIHPLLRKNQNVIQAVETDIQSLRAAYPGGSRPQSFLDSQAADNEEWNEKEESIFSNLSEREFEFDGILMGSRAYRPLVIAATEVIRQKHSRSISAPTRLRTFTNTSNQRNGRIQVANQSTKIDSPGAGPSVSQDGLQGVDPSTFVQQLHEFMDHAKQEMLQATDEAARLRENLKEKDALIHDLQSDKLDLAERLGQMESELKQAKDAGLVRETALRGREVAIDELSSELTSTKRERASMLEFRANEAKKYQAYVSQNAVLRSRITVLKSRVANWELLQAKYESDIITITNQRNQVLGELNSSNSERKSSYDGLDSCELSLKDGGITQIGSVLLIPLSQPAWSPLGDQPMAYQVAHAPKVPQGWYALWNNDSKTWGFVNRYTKKTQSEMPKSAAESPLQSVANRFPPQSSKSKETKETFSLASKISLQLPVTKQPPHLVRTRHSNYDIFKSEIERPPLIKANEVPLQSLGKANTKAKKDKEARGLPETPQPLPPRSRKAFTFAKSMNPSDTVVDTSNPCIADDIIINASVPILVSHNTIDIATPTLTSYKENDISTPTLTTNKMTDVATPALTSDKVLNDPAPILTSNKIVDIANPILTPNTTVDISPAPTKPNNAPQQTRDSKEIPSEPISRIKTNIGKFDFGLGALDFDPSSFSIKDMQVTSYPITDDSDDEFLSMSEDDDFEEDGFSKAADVKDEGLSVFVNRVMPWQADVQDKTMVY